ncbi:hypothetical protein [Phyllobacterium myrsinacearum]|uniref:Lysozyme family protein n=1 Tax=Phyllobacterium myrsinacearum TaxID=28101 RepID=A0A839EW50_9HYPH|nr:hypothetical protein [Phyllobacterium myrsinacearum]MBA8881744.1 lysozyme family protein [Phyllobacterium myrsinacearum]
MSEVKDHIAELIEAYRVNKKLIAYGISATQALIDGVKVEANNVDEETAMELFEVDYLEVPGFDDLPAELHSQLFAIGVIVGTTRAALMLQSALREFAPRKTQHITGIMELDNYTDCASLVSRGKTEELIEMVNLKFADLCKRLDAKFPTFRTLE